MKVISYKNMPVRLPVGGSCVLYLLLDRFQAPGWVWGVLGTLLAILWIVAVHKMFTQKQTELFEAEK